MSKSVNGTVMVEVTVGALLTLLVTSAIFFLVMHFWTRTYVKTESYFLARARLYGKTTCQPATKLLSQSWVDRTPQCGDGGQVDSHYRFLPGMQTPAQAESDISIDLEGL